VGLDENDIFPKPVAPKRCGRHRDSDNLSQRQKHIETALIYFCTNWPLARIGVVHGVCEKTIQRWIYRALTYEEADTIRILAQTYRRKIKLPENREYP
jgi:hypothetical protein